MIGQEMRLPAGTHPAIPMAYSKLAERINTMVDSTARRIGNPTLRASYDSAKRDYRMGSLLESALFRAEAKSLTRGPAGHNTLLGVLGQVAEALTGLPPVGQIARNVAANSAPVVKGLGHAGTSLRSTIGPNVPMSTELELANYLQSRFGKKP